MGAARGVLVTDPALAGSCARSTVQVLAAALRDLDVRPRLRRRGHLGRRRRGRRRRRSRRCSGCRTSRTPRAIEPDPAPDASGSGGSRPTGYDLLEAPMPALVVVHPGARRAALPVAQGDHGARARRRSRRGRLADLGLAAGEVGGARRDDGAARQPAATGPRPRPASSAAPADEAAREIVDFLVERRLI